ncbi:hypothetical protein RHS01_05926 [Rhizoctonia solani]|uniref:Uncharacterized protein n=1 Tax=Rhizoctonia solani TaxID=456999 RepID=A0A8H7ICR6_9AGAM|nr:hypothetical protein RHS01_05926 [Rhizoctonia solani]
MKLAIRHLDLEARGWGVFNGHIHLAKISAGIAHDPHSHIHDASPAEDAQKIADDALGLLFNFEEIGAELALTNDGQFKKEWDDAYQEFRKGLEEAVKLAEMGKKYLLDFNEKVVSRFSEGNVDWEKDKDLVADFVKENGGEELVRQSRMVEDKFKEIKYAIEWFESMYGEKTEEKGVAYNAKVKQIDQERRNIQSQIESNRSASAQLQGAMGRTAGPGCLLVRIVRAVITLLFGRRNRVFSAANNRVSQLQREEQDLLAQRAAVDRRANELVKDAAALTQTRHAMSVLVDNVGDMTGRLGTLASSWSQTFARRMSNIGKSTSFLTANMDAWTKGIAPDGVLAKPKKKPSSYDISNSYGGSDGVAFNDARPELDSAISIASIKVVRSAGIDGLQHTPIEDANYRLSNWHKASVGPYGTGAGLAGGASFTWTGRLLCFAGVANNSVPSLGLRGIKFVQMKS